MQQYTALIARTHKDLMVSSCSPGFIDTAITKGFGASKTPDEGTKVIRHCLFNELEASGYVCAWRSATGNQSIPAVCADTLGVM